MPERLQINSSDFEGNIGPEFGVRGTMYIYYITYIILHTLHIPYYILQTSILYRIHIILHITHITYFIHIGGVS